MGTKRVYCILGIYGEGVKGKRLVSQKATSRTWRLSEKTLLFCPFNQQSSRPSRICEQAQGRPPARGRILKLLIGSPQATISNRQSCHASVSFSRSLDTSFRSWRMSSIANGFSMNSLVNMVLSISDWNSFL